MTALAGALAMPPHSAYGEVPALLQPQPVPARHANPAHPVSLFALYRLCFVVGLFSFGGGLTAWFHREVVQVRSWMTDDEFFPAIRWRRSCPA